MIVLANSQHLSRLLNLWASYQYFYEVKSIDAQCNQAFIEHIFAHPQEGLIHVYLIDNEPIAFSTLYFTYTSTAVTKVAVLNDLYVEPAHRQNGIAQALLDNACSVVQEQGIPVMRWITQESNTVAQKLYQKYTKPSKWLLYTLKV